ncbi:unnamed protein product [Urochloa humidicola]
MKRHLAPTAVPVLSQRLLSSLAEAAGDHVTADGRPPRGATGPRGHRWLTAEATSHLHLALDSARPRLVARDGASPAIGGARPHQVRAGRRRPRTSDGAKFPRPRHGFSLERFGLYFHRTGEIGRVELHPIDLAAGVIPASLHPPLQIQRVELHQWRRHPIHHAAGAGTIPAYLYPSAPMLPRLVLPYSYCRIE